MNCLLSRNHPRHHQVEDEQSPLSKNQIDGPSRNTLINRDRSSEPRAVVARGGAPSWKGIAVRLGMTDGRKQTGSWRYSTATCREMHLVCSIHDSDLFHWHTSGKENSSLRSPWINISRQWHKVEAFADSKLERGTQLCFGWTSGWTEFALKTSFLCLYRIALFPKGSISGYWDFSTFSWFLNFTRLLKEEEISDFQLLFGSLDRTRPSTLEDKRSWSLESHGFFVVKSEASSVAVVAIKTLSSWLSNQSTAGKMPLEI
ncbi:hypothetical protein E5676_scaffold453G00230 [Cucumis melo var. makuwa]|uniref:Uncharacterized protein n=1 Tax=Cucumis melo var. makuwa TaxID=1194695 RepID=A0A5D3C5M7_CUCMM|nr:hypothetical protein E5676_scaffold453G00230 [Cucumis melo var. makuwa]